MPKARNNDHRDSAVWVTYGIHRVSFDTLAGQALAHAREVLHVKLGIPQDAPALANGRSVGEEHVIRAGEVLEFIAEAGKMQ